MHANTTKENEKATTPKSISTPTNLATMAAINVPTIIPDGIYRNKFKRNSLRCCFGIFLSIDIIILWMWLVGHINLLYP